MSDEVKITDLDDPLYNTPVKLRGYWGKVVVTTMVYPRDAGKVLIKLRPDMTKTEHMQLASKFFSLAKSLRKSWNETLEKAAQETWGRPWGAFGYRVSGIGSDEFSDEFKTKLRHLAHSYSKAQRVGGAHEYASKLLRRL